MRDDNMRVWEQLAAERRKVDKLINVIGRLWDVVGKSFPGMGQSFSVQASESPNIYITSPTATSRYPPPLSMNMHSMHSMGSPNSSPTAVDFPSSHMHHGHPHHFHSLLRQHSFQHISSYRGDSMSSTPLQSSPGSISMELFDDGTGDPPPSGRSSSNRQRVDESRTGVGVNNSPDSMSMMSSVSSPGSNTGPGMASLAVPKKSSRARSDSTPLGYAGVLWQQGGLSGPSGPGVMGRLRSGSGLMPRGIPNIGNMMRNNNASMPLLSITTQG
ncbi:hypothetical protein CPB84DRAFT_1838755 [Gymnopilus junonius]|uniref:Uncharacterized protein n=1 Tax=Gymnopilus junonius TaxID=109634 RepID=A0A9P5NA86_GYMJU|nr:hypothetical protein CPB84DRAFT_1838755 [Gymnopilus junonius]